MQVPGVDAHAMPDASSPPNDPVASRSPNWFAAPQLPPVRLQPALSIVGASWRRYSLPLRKPLTTGAELGHRSAVLFRISAHPLDAVDQTQTQAGLAAKTDTGTPAMSGCIAGVGEVCNNPYGQQHLTNRLLTDAQRPQRRRVKQTEPARAG